MFIQIVIQQTMPKRSKIYPINSISVNVDDERTNSRCVTFESKRNTETTAKEDRLALQLKQICNSDGKELDIKKSADIFHKLGKEYCDRSPDMFCLIRSAALYNAAIARSPDNVEEVEKDLNNLCQLILREAFKSIAKARNQSFDLVSKAKEVKQLMLKWRKEVKTAMAKIELSSNDASPEKQKFYNDVEQLQNQITEKYVAIMADVAEYCENILGQAPFPFAIAGMGSLARKEITPYSDFEHIILLSNVAIRHPDYENCLDYYRWFSVIFHVILINLQETILPSVAIPSLNNKYSRFGDWFYDAFTSKGISFDGMMVQASKIPFGRSTKTELIKPVKEMLKLLSSDKNLKNDYFLGDILTKACFVYKDRAVFNEFLDGTFCEIEKCYLNSSLQKELKKQVTEDLKRFSMSRIVASLKTKKKVNIKQVIYRCTTLFISALGKLENIRASSSFEIVEELANQNIINEYAKEQLKFAIALACIIRLRWYIQNKKQCDTIETRLPQKAITRLMNIVGKTNTVKYFQIAFAFQNYILKRLDIFTLYANPFLFNLKMQLCFDYFNRLQNCFSFSLQPSLFEEDSKCEPLHYFKYCLQSMKTHENLVCGELEMKRIQKCGIKLLLLDYIESSLQCFETVQLHFEYWNEIENGPNKPSTILASNCFLMGICLLILGQREVASKSFNQCVSYIQQAKVAQLADVNCWIGHCWLQMQNPKNVVSYLQQSFDLIKFITIDNDCALANIRYWIGYCFLKNGEYENAMKHLEQSLRMKTNVSHEPDSDSDIAEIQLQCGKCLHLLKKPEDALMHLKQSLAIKDQIKNNFYSQRNSLETTLSHEFCSEETAILDMPIHVFMLMLDVKENLSLGLAHKQSIAKTKSEIGYCLLEINKVDEAVDYLESAQEITELIYSDANSDVAKIVEALAECFNDLKEPEKALNKYKQLLNIEVNLNLRKRCIIKTQNLIRSLEIPNEHREGRLPVGVANRHNKKQLRRRKCCVTAVCTNVLVTFVVFIIVIAAIALINSHFG